MCTYANKQQHKSLEIQDTRTEQLQTFAPASLEEQLAQSSQRIGALRQEIEQGPPNTFKYSMKRNQEKWYREKRTKLNKEEAEQFYLPSQFMLNHMAGELEKQYTAIPAEEQKVSLYAQALDKTLEKGPSVDQKKLFRSTAPTPPEALTSLLAMQDYLAANSSMDVQPERLIDYCQKYKTLVKNDRHPASRYFDDVGYEDPISLYVLLQASVSLAIKDQLEAMPQEQLNLGQLARQNALAATANMAAGSMVASAAFRQKRAESAQAIQDRATAEREEQARRKAAADAAQAERDRINRQVLEEEARHKEQDLAKQRADRHLRRQVYLKTGVMASQKTDSWLLKDYAAQAEAWLGKRMDELDDRAFTETVALMTVRLTEKTKVYINHQVKETGQKVLGSARLCQMMEEELWRELDDRLFDETLTQEAVAQAAEQLLEKPVMAGAVAEYQRRRKELEALPGISVLGDVTGIGKVDALLVDEKDEQNFFLRSQLLSRQASFNLDNARVLIAQRISPLNREAALQVLIDHLKEALLFSAPGPAAAAVDRELMHFRQYAPGILAQEDLLNQTMLKLDIPLCWRDLACSHLTQEDTTPEQMKAKLEPLQKDLVKKEDAFQDAVKSRKLTTAQWEEILYWKEANITLEQAAFSNRLMALLEENQSLQAGGLTLKEYNAQYETPAAEVKTHYSKLLRGSAFCTWEGFGTMFQGMEERLLPTLKKLLKKQALPYPYLKNIRSVSELDNLTYGDFTMLVTQLRANVAGAAYAWERLQEVDEDFSVRKHLLPKLLRGALNEDNMDTYIRRALKKNNKQEQVHLLRFSQVMEEASGPRTEPNYQYLETTRTSTIGDQRSRAEKRTIRLDHAAEVWSVLSRVPQLTKGADGPTPVRVHDKLQYLDIGLLQQYQTEHLKGKGEKDSDILSMLKEQVSLYREKDVSKSTRQALIKNVSALNETIATLSEEIGTIAAKLQTGAKKATETEESAPKNAVSKVFGDKTPVTPALLEEKYQALTAARQELDQAKAKLQEHLDGDYVSALNYVMEQYLSPAQKSDACVTELRLVGSDAAFLEHRTAMGQFQGESRDDYEAYIQKNTYSIQSRTLSLLDNLSAWGVPRQEQAHWLQRMRPFLVSLPERLDLDTGKQKVALAKKALEEPNLSEPMQKVRQQELDAAEKALLSLERKKEKNLEKFGVGDWTEAVNHLYERLSRPKDAAPTKQELRLQAGQALVEKRMALLAQRDHGILQPLMPMLMEREGLRTQLLSDSDKAFEKHTKKLVQKLTPILEALDVWLDFGPQYVDQLLQNQKASILHVLRHHNTDPVDWRGEFDRFYKEYITHKVGKTSIDDRLTRLQNTDIDAFRALMSLIHDPSVSVEICKNDEAFQTAIVDAKHNLVPNRLAFNRFCREQQLPSVEAVGLEMYAHEAMLKSNPQKFAQELQPMLNIFRANQEITRQETRRSQQRMDTKRQIMLDVEAHKAMGRIEPTAEDTAVDTLRASAKKASSLLLNMMGTPPGLQMDVLIQDARREVQSNYQDQPKVVRDFLAEILLNRYLTPEVTPIADAVEEQVTANMDPQLSAGLKAVGDNLKRLLQNQEMQPEIRWVLEEYNTIQQLSQSGEIAQNLSPEQTYELLLSRYVQRKKAAQAPASQPPAQTEEADELVDDQKAFANKQNYLDTLRNIHLTDPAMEAQRFRTLEALRYGKYTMGETEFKNLAVNRIQYFRRSATLSRLLDEKLAELKSAEGQSPMDDDELLRLKTGLLEYFHGYVVRPASSTAQDGLVWEDSIRQEVTQLLKSKEHIQYLKNSKVVLEGMGNQSLTAKEQAFRTGVTRTDVEALLGTDPEAMAAYQQLTRQERQVFALSVLSASQVKGDIRLFSSFLLRDKELETAQTQTINLALFAYTHHKPFDPVIDYSRVKDALKTTAPNAAGVPVDTLDKTVFDNALRITNVAKAQYARNIPKDFARLANGAATLKAMEKIPHMKTDGKQKPVTRSIRNPEDFFEQVGKLVGEEKLSGLGPAQKLLLIQILQDRTILDYTATVATKKKADAPPYTIVNPVQRQRLKDRWLSSSTAVGDLSINSETLTRAYQTLLSYQIRDDVDLTGRQLTAMDFAPSVLLRTSAVDMTLLDRALAFIKEIDREALRKTAVRQASSLIDHEKYPNKLAQAAHNDLKASYETKKEDVTRDYVEAFLASQAIGQKKEQERCYPLLAGIADLNAQQFSLFITALNHREILDVSKEQIGNNRLGIAERDYVDTQERNQILDDYLSIAKGTDASVPLEPDSLYKALEATLSTQVRDDIDFTKEESTDLFQALTSNSNIFKQGRDTAVDWKLVQRALQFVHRAENEKNIFLEDRELYMAQGDISEDGSFTFNGTFLRKNIHNAGNRFTRFLGRRAVIRSKDLIDALMDEMPEELSSALAFAQENYQYVVSAEMNNQLSQNAVLKTWQKNAQPEEEQPPEEEAAQETTQQETTEQETAEQEAPEQQETQEESGGFLQSIQGAFSSEEETPAEQEAQTAEPTTEQKIQQAVAPLLPVVTGLLDFRKSKNDAQLQKADDLEKSMETAARIGEVRAARMHAAEDRNSFLMEEAGKTAHARKAEDVVNIVAEQVGTVLGETAGPGLKDLVGTAVQEAGHMINFMVNYCTELSSIKRYFQNSGDAERLRKKLPKIPGAEKIDDLDLVREGLGYENNTELGSFIGLNMTRSLLYCASPFMAKAQRNLYLLSVATLTLLGQSLAIGKQDTATALAVYDALMGGAYRG